MAIAERILVMHISRDVLIKSPWIQHICTGWCVTCCTNIGKIWRGQKWGQLWWSSGSSTELIFVFISSVVISQDPQPELFIRFAFPSFAFSFLYSFIPSDPLKRSPAPPCFSASTNQDPSSLCVMGLPDSSCLLTKSLTLYHLFHPFCCNLARCPQIRDLTSYLHSLPNHQPASFVP